MQITIYNTMSRSLEQFVPQDPSQVSIYSCGPTVYSRQHLGNLRAAFLVDLYKNVIKYIGGYPVKHVMNITDVGHLTDDGDQGEDKMEKGARQQGSTARDVAEKFTKIYLEDLALLKIDPFDVMPRATDHIAEQIAMVQELEAKGYTYIIENDGVYMDTSKVDEYGKLIGKKHMEGLSQGARVDDAGKRNATDFALWKFNITGKKRDMERESPRGVGFPGRHIECSAMSIKYLGKHIDIHTGGMEHIAIHHTNEICQSECSHGHTPWVNYRIHNQWLMMNGKKIAKSDGNVAFMNEVIERGYSGEDMRYFFLQAQYRSFQDFSREGLEAASSALINIKNKTIYAGFFDKNEIKSEIERCDFSSKDLHLESNEGKNLYEELVSSLCNDFNTPQFLAEFSKLTKSIQKKAVSYMTDVGNTLGYEEKDILYKDMRSMLYFLDQKILKIGLYEELKEYYRTGPKSIIPSDIQALAEQRRQAKSEKDRATADALRDQLHTLGWTMQDTKDGYEIVAI